MPEMVLQREANGVATLILNRPDKLNAFADDMREQMIAAIENISRSEARVLVITGAGRAFCSGGDIRYMVSLKENGADFGELRKLLDLGREAITCLTQLRIPTIAAVNGVAAGAGLNLALACDMRIASDQASFGETFVRSGLHPDWGGSYHLPRLVGTAKALELCWLGGVIEADEALRIGLVNRVVPHDRFDAEVKDLAARLASAPQTSIREIKGTIQASLDRTLGQSLDAEEDAQERCWNSADVEEGLKAFVEKRQASFTAKPAAVKAGMRFE